MAERAAIEVSDLAVRFRQRERTIHAVNGISFRLARGDAVRLDDREPVFPDWAIDLRIRAPCLRREFQHVGMLTLARDRFDELPAVHRIGFCYVPVERGRLLRQSRADGREQDKNRLHGLQQL